MLGAVLPLHLVEREKLLPDESGRSFSVVSAEGGHDKGLELVPVAHDEDDEHNDGQGRT